MAETQNIVKSDDKFFRYKMPKMQTKIEGRGNGIKTVIVNMLEISKALNLQPDYPTKYFGIELGAQSKFDKTREQAVVNGAHDTNKLAGMLSKFIEAFVLCPNCRLPEIMWEVDEKKGLVKVDCAACGNHSTLNPQHKLTSYILKNPPSSFKKKGNKGKEQEDVESEEEPSHLAADTSKKAQVSVEESRKPTKSNVQAKDDNVEEEWSMDTSKEAQLERRELEKKAMGISSGKEEKTPSKTATEKKDPAPLLKEFMQDSTKSNVQILAELRRLCLARNLNESAKLKVLVDSVFDTTNIKSVPKQILLRKELLEAASPDKATRAMLFIALEEFLANDKLLPIVTPFLSGLYQCELFSEEFLECWYESPPETSLTITKAFSVEIRNQAKPFFEWLKNAEEESDDE